MIGKVSVAILGAIIGSLVSVAAVVYHFGWGTSGHSQAAFVDPTRGDYVDLLLTLVTILLAAIGLAVTVGALVIGLVALKTLREIKDEAKDAAAKEVKDTISAELEPTVTKNVNEALPSALRDALQDDKIGHVIFTDIARTGALDEVLGRVMERLQSGGPVKDPSDVVEGGDQD